MPNRKAVRQILSLPRVWHPFRKFRKISSLMFCYCGVHVSVEYKLRKMLLKNDFTHCLGSMAAGLYRPTSQINLSQLINSADKGTLDFKRNDKVWYSHSVQLDWKLNNPEPYRKQILLSKSGSVESALKGPDRARLRDAEVPPGQVPQDEGRRRRTPRPGGAVHVQVINWSPAAEPAGLWENFFMKMGHSKERPKVCLFT